MNEFIDFLEENKIEGQDEQIITNFKDKINKPVEYITHLDEFKFDKKWFEQLDIILTELGYRALDADINHIRNWLNDKLITAVHINKIDLDYDVKNLIKLNKTLSLSTNLEILTYLIDDCPHKINYRFSENTSDIAVKYCIKHSTHKIQLDDDAHVDIDWWVFSQNVNDIAVSYMLERSDKIGWYYFSNNENPTAVKYLIHTHPDKIDWGGFSQNKNIDAVQYCLKNLDKINWHKFSLNSAELAVKYLIEHPERIDINWFILNKSDTAVQYLLEHHITDDDDDEYFDWDDFSQNEADTAVRYLIEHPDKIDWVNFSHNRNILAVKYCIKNNKITDYEYLLLEEKIHADKITSFNKLNWLPKSNMQLRYVKN